MRIGILGSGSVGQTLATGLSAMGHDVVVGTRDPDTKRAALAPKIGKAKVTSLADAAKHGELVILSVHGSAVTEAVKAAGPANLSGKTVIDTTNPLEFGPNGAHKPRDLTTSLLERAQDAAPKAHFVKAWNCTPGGKMISPAFSTGKGDQFICGNDAAAKEQATELLGKCGWNAIDVGDATMARHIEGMALTVINFGARANDWSWGLKLVR